MSHKKVIFTLCLILTLSLSLSSGLYFNSKLKKDRTESKEQFPLSNFKVAYTNTAVGCENKELIVDVVEIKSTEQKVVLQQDQAKTELPLNFCSNKHSTYVYDLVQRRGRSKILVESKECGKEQRLSCSELIEINTLEATGSATLNFSSFKDKYMINLPQDFYILVSKINKQEFDKRIKYYKNIMIDFKPGNFSKGFINSSDIKESTQSSNIKTIDLIGKGVRVYLYY